MSIVRPTPIRPPGGSSRTLPSTRTALRVSGHVVDPDDTGLLVVLRHSIKNVAAGSTPRDMKSGATVGVAGTPRLFCATKPSTRKQMATSFIIAGDDATGSAARTL